MGKKRKKIEHRHQKPKAIEQKNPNQLASLGDIISIPLEKQLKQIASYKPTLSSTEKTTSKTTQPQIIKSNQQVNQVNQVNQTKPTLPVQNKNVKEIARKNEVTRRTQTTISSQSVTPKPQARAGANANANAKYASPTIRTNSPNLILHREEIAIHEPPTIINIEPNKFLDLIRKRLEETKMQGHQTQVRPVTINLGIDLGTSYSKVVCRIGDDAYPVCFGSQHNKLDDYLVPSIVVFDGQSFITGCDGLCEADLKSHNAIPNFKMCLACVSSEDGLCNITKCTLSNWQKPFPDNIRGHEVKVVTAIFLAKLIAKTKEIIISQLIEEGYKNTDAILWSSNLAVPEKFMDQSPTLSTFESIFKTAWLMALVFDQEPDLQNTSDILLCYEAARTIVEEPENVLDCFVYPEVAAEVACVTMARETQDGLYAFVDIGAGTVDSSVFRLYTEQDRQHITYAADVIKLGAAKIERAASDKLKDEAITIMRDLKENNSSVNTDSFRNLFQLCLDETLDGIENEVTNSLNKVFKNAYSKELNTNKWVSLKLILGGGGSALKAYQRSASKGFTLKHEVKNQTPQQIVLPKPIDFQMQGLSSSDFHRFAVAYGLSFDKVNLSEFVLASQVEPLAPIVQAEFIDPTDDG